MPGNDGDIAVEIAIEPEKGATMGGNCNKTDRGSPPQDDRAPKTPPTAPEDDEEDGDIATPKRDRDDE